MRELRQHLEKLRKVKKHRHHRIQHRIHKKYKISKKTLFYIKEYGPHTNVPRTIIKESIRILLLASLISSFGGFMLESIKPAFVTLLPFVVLLPAMNGIIGNFGTIISSKFSTMLLEGEVMGKAWKNKQLKKLFMQVFLICIITAAMSFFVSILLSGISGYYSSALLALKILAIILLDVVVLVGFLFAVSIIAGLHYYRNGLDPNNFLIPITTSVADFGSMALLSLLIILIF